MIYSGPQPISPSPLAGVLDDDLLNTYNQLFPEGTPQKPQYQSSSLAGSYQNFLGSPSSSSGSGQNTDWSKYVDNHSDLSQAYLDYESQAVAKGDVPKPKWAWGKDHYQEFGKNESGRNLTGVSQNLIEEVTGPPAMTSYDQITQSIIDRDTNNNNANAQINALNRQSDDYRTDVTAQTQFLGSLFNLQGIRESEAGATARQDSVNETQLNVETLRGSNAIDLQEITNSGLAAVENIRQAGAENVANIQKEANNYAVDSEKDWRKYSAELDAEARLGAALAQKEGLLGSADIRGKADIRVGELQSEASKYGAELDLEARLGAAEAQKEGVLGSADIRGKADIRVGELQSEATKFSALKDAEARLGAAQAQKEAILGAENIKAKGALDLQPIINAGLADVARFNKEATLGAAEITGKYGVEEEKIRGMSAKDVAKIQSRGNVFGNLVSAFNF